MEMESSLQLIEKYGFTMIACVGLSFVLYKVIMFVLVNKAKEFSDNHKETRAVVVEAEAKIERMARKFEDFAGDFKIFKEVILDLIKERNRK
tara:strand:- start:793 stop:1068 length:276 start_codon:yes stop_codon:yes gene_type:complete